MSTMQTQSETSTWPDLAEGLYAFLTGRGATIEYGFDNLEVLPPERDRQLARRQVAAERRPPDPHLGAGAVGPAMLDVAGAVEIGFGGGQGRLVAQGRMLRFELDEGARLDHTLGIGTLRALSEGLARAGLTLRVCRGERVLLRAGTGTHPGALGRLLRLPHVELSPRFALSSALARRSGR